MSERPEVLDLPEERWRAQLREVAADLEALRFRLLGMIASLPSGQEPGPDSTFRADIECVVTDRLDPAADALRRLIAEAADPTAEEGVE